MSKKDKSILTPEQRCLLNLQIGSIMAEVSSPTLALGYIRYEKLRLLNVQQYAELSKRNLDGEGSFDDLVDGLEGPK